MNIDEYEEIFEYDSLLKRANLQVELIGINKKYARAIVNQSEDE